MSSQHGFQVFAKNFKSHEIKKFLTKIKINLSHYKCVPGGSANGSSGSDITFSAWDCFCGWFNLGILLEKLELDPLDL